jgi:predicted aconitase with swiveling domain
MSETVFKLNMLIEGEASGPLIVSHEALSFWGGVDARTGEVIDRRHPLSGQLLAKKILVFPGSRGSSSGSGVLLEAIRNHSAPAAIITVEADHILALAALLGRELYGRNPPVAVAPPGFLEWAEQQAGNTFSLRPDGSFISGA